jgi:hypothetical protein
MLARMESDGLKEPMPFATSALQLGQPSFGNVAEARRYPRRARLEQEEHEYSHEKARMNTNTTLLLYSCSFVFICGSFRVELFQAILAQCSPGWKATA